MSRSQFSFMYHRKRWFMRRRAQLRKEPLCVICLQRGIATPATIADHIIPHKGDWNSFWTGDLQSLCFTHHNGSKREIEEKGFCSDVGVDGWPLDPNHYANNKAALRTRNKKPIAKKHNLDLLG